MWMTCLRLSSRRRCGLQISMLGMSARTFVEAGCPRRSRLPPTSRKYHQPSSSTNPTAKNLSKWVASGLRLSRSRPRSSLSATTRVSLSTSRPTSASAMRLLSFPASACATRYASAHRLQDYRTQDTRLTVISDCRLHHSPDEAHSAWSRPRYLLQASGGGA